MLPELYIGHSTDFVEENLFILIRFLLLSSSDRSVVYWALLTLKSASSKVSIITNVDKVSILLIL